MKPKPKTVALVKSIVLIVATLVAEHYGAPAVGLTTPAPCTDTPSAE